MARFAVIDTETNWHDQVMSIGTVIADSEGFRLLAGRYHIITPEYKVGGMFSDTLFLDCGRKPILCSREEAMADLSLWLAKYGWKTSMPTMPASTAPISPSLGISTGSISCVWQPIASITPCSPPPLNIALPAASVAASGLNPCCGCSPETAATAKVTMH